MKRTAGMTCNGRAERSGMMDEPSFWEKANPAGYDDDCGIRRGWAGKTGPVFH